jgi:signal transduction histidine kinase
MRESIVIDDLVDEVHSLPQDTFKSSTGIKVSIICLNKAKPASRKGKVSFIEVDSSDLNIKDHDQTLLFDREILKKERVVGLEEIENNDWLLNSNRYVNYFRFTDEYISIENVIKEIKYGKSISKQELRKKGTIPYVNVNNLSDSIQNINLNLSKVEYFIPESSTTQKEILNKEAVLISKVGLSIKPTYFDGKASIVFDQNILALVLDQKQILPQYFLNQLQQDYVQQQLNRIRGGTVFSFIRQKDFLSIRIKVPSIAVQEKELLDLFQREGVAFIKSNDSIRSETERRLLSSIKHEFSNLKEIVDGDIYLLKLFLDKSIKNRNPISWDNSLSQMPGARNLEQLFFNINNTLNEMGEVFPRLQQIMDFRSETLRKEPVNILSFVKAQVELCGNLTEDVRIIYAINGKHALEEDITVEIDKKQFSTVILNFIRNSVKHGLNDVIKLIIVIDVRQSEDKLFTELLLMNDGKPFPENFTIDDFKAFGVKSGSKGSGIGGYLMNMVVENHGGTLELMHFNENEFLVINPNFLARRKEGVYLEQEQYLYSPTVGFKITLPV